MATASKSQMTQAQWLQWAQQREADAPRIEKLYRKQSADMMRVLTEAGCICNPLIQFNQTPQGPAINGHPIVTHALDCTNN